jgi:hypothetical protein
VKIILRVALFVGSFNCSYKPGIFCATCSFFAIDLNPGKSLYVPTQNGIVIAGTDRAYKISNGVVYSSITQNRQLNALLPIGRTYPVIVQNSKIKYKTGTLQGMILGYTFDEERQIIVNDVVAQTEEIIDFLCDGKAKVITDWNGNVWLVRITDNPVVSPKDTTGATNTISFSWTEQGKYNIESDLIENNLIVKE